MRKNITKIVLAAVLGLGMLLPSAGCSDCDHNVGTWEVDVEATCQTTGSRHGICGICYETVTEVIPADPSAHVYGDWEILTTPSETTIGRAKTICTVNTAHTLEQVLPALGDTAYKSEITTRPTPAKDGVRTYVYKHDAGDIVFTQPVPADGIQSVRDAADLGAAEESRELVRKADGFVRLQYYNKNQTTPKQLSKLSHSYEFGEDHTYLQDGVDNYERWYFEQDGKIYGLRKKKGETKIEDDKIDSSSNDKYIYGSRLYVQYVNDLGYFYGVEGLLEGMYRSAVWSSNADFKEWVEEPTEEGGKPTYCFSFGHVQGSGDNSSYFSIVTTKFTLSDSFTVDHIQVQSYTYPNNSAQADEVHSWEFDEEGFARVLPGLENTAERYCYTIEFNQTLKQEGDVLLKNEHTFENMYVQDFDLTYHGEKLTDEGLLPDGSKAQFASGEYTNYVFAIVGVTPTSALTKYSFDGFGFYLRTTNEKGQTVDIPIDYSTMVEVGMTASMNSQKQFFLNAQQKGEQTVVVKTKYVEKLIQCEIAERAPDAIYPAVYGYMAGSYSWDRMVESESTSVTKSIYAGQPLFFKVDVPVAQKNYASSSYVINSLTKDGASVNFNAEGASYFLSTVKDGEPVTQFTASAPGKYMITLASKLDVNKMCTVTVNVTAAPTMAELTAKTYGQVLEILKDNEDTDVTVTFKDDLTAVKEMVDGEEKITAYTVTARIETGDESYEEIKCTYTLEDGQLNSEHLSGREDFGFKLMINEAYDFVLSHYSETFETFEEVVLYQK